MFGVVKKMTEVEFGIPFEPDSPHAIGKELAKTRPLISWPLNMFIGGPAATCGKPIKDGIPRNTLPRITFAGCGMGTADCMAETIIWRAIGAGRAYAGGYQYHCKHDLDNLNELTDAVMEFAYTVMKDKWDDMPIYYGK
jgi:hypothetical protein